MRETRTRNEVHFGMRTYLFLGFALGVYSGERILYDWWLVLALFLGVLWLTLRAIRKEREDDA